MDYAATNIILLDERVQRDRVELGTCAPSKEPTALVSDINSLLSVFNSGRLSMLFLVLLELIWLSISSRIEFRIGLSHESQAV